MKKTAWAIDELIEAGYTYDSSIFPVHHDRYGVADAPTKPFRCFGLNSQVGIIEIPPLTLRMGFTNIPIGGGGLLSIIPTRFTQGRNLAQSLARALCFNALLPSLGV